MKRLVLVTSRVLAQIIQPLKIRNYNRLLKEITRWKDHNLQDNLAWLDNSTHGRALFPLQRYQTHRIRKMNEVARNININYQIVLASKANMMHWYKILAEDYTSFYLAVWLFPNDTRESQIVIGIEERAAYYQQLVQNTSAQQHLSLHRKLAQIPRLCIQHKMIQPLYDLVLQITLKDQA